MQEQFLKKDTESSYKKDLEYYMEVLESKYPTTVKDAIYSTLIESVERRITLADQCDSPIEFLLAEQLENELEIFNGSVKRYYYFHPQTKIPIGEQVYKVDFLIAPVTREGDTRFPNLIIECDGHDFHEKTKEQVKKDKKRDRYLQLSGFRILRFSGSEIHDDPFGCAREVLDFLKQLDSKCNL